MAHPSSLVVERAGHPDVRYLVRGEFGTVEYRPREQKLTLTRPGDPELVAVKDGATAAVRKAGLILDTEGVCALRVYLLRWYSELPSLLRAPAANA